MRGNKADAFLRTIHVPLQPVASEAVAVEVIHTAMGIQAQHEGIGRRIRTKAEFLIVPVAALRMRKAVFGQAAKVLQHISVLLVRAQGVDEFIKLVFEILGFQITPVIRPRGEKALAVAAHISAQVADAAGLRFNLTALGIAVHPLQRGHCSDAEVHHLSRSFFLGFLLDSASNFASVSFFSRFFIYSGW